jgi:hypothetical protein
MGSHSYSVERPPRVGDLVYPAFNPKRIGVVRRVELAQNPNGWNQGSGVSATRVFLEWPDGPLEEVSAYWALGSLEDLVEGTAKTLESHHRRREAAMQRFGLPRP